MHRAAPDVGNKSLSYERALLEPVATTAKAKKADPSLMECILAAHTIIRDTEDIAGTVIESDSNSTQNKPGPRLNSVVKPSSDMRSEIEAYCLISVW